MGGFIEYMGVSKSMAALAIWAAENGLWIAIVLIRIGRRAAVKDWASVCNFSNAN
jgi:predicted acetyltransferase